MVHQDPPHGLRRDRAEMRPVLSIGLALIDQPQIRLVDQGRAVRAQVRSFLPQQTRGQPAQFLVDEWKQLVRGSPAPGAQVDEQLRCIGSHIRSPRMARA